MSDPYFILCPLRLEKLSEDPSISIFHDFLSDMEMKSMKHAIMAQMQVSTVQDITVEDGGGIKTSTERTQSSGWLWDEYNPLLYQMSKGSFISFSNQPRRTRLGRATKLKTYREKVLEDHEPLYFLEAEAWQVGVYSPGGHYLPHFDDFEILDPQSVRPDGTWVGNRIATAIAYLSDVEGGYTAFPNLGVAAQPRQGSVLFWYNLRSDGTRDRLAMHGACPTILGIKWVTNKWIREGAQIWARPCHLQSG